MLRDHRLAQRPCWAPGLRAGSGRLKQRAASSRSTLRPSASNRPFPSPPNAPTVRSEPGRAPGYTRKVVIMLKKGFRGSTVVITAAVCLVLGAGGTAIGAKLITGKDVKDGSLTAADIKQGTLTSGDVKDGNLTAADIKQGTLTSADVK